VYSIVILGAVKSERVLIFWVHSLFGF